MNSLQGKVAIVTGGAKGIGEAVVRRFVADGASVVIADIDVENGTRIAAESAAVEFVECNVDSVHTIEKIGYAAILTA